MKKKIVCPHCGKSNTWREDNPYRPFCSERCRLIDLGSWAKEDYKIPSEETDDQVSQNDEDTDK